MRKESYKFYKHIGECSCKFFSDCLTGFAFIGDVTSALVYAVFHPRKIRWKETLYYMDNCGSDALPIVTVVGFLVGFVLAIQGAIQLERFGAKLMVTDLVVLALVKELGPLMVAIVATGRAGSSFAAEIGTMKVTEEIDALVAMGFEVSRFLVIPKLIAMIVVMPILVIFGNVAGIIGGMFVTYFKLGISIPETIEKIGRILMFSDYIQSLVKSLVFGVIVAGVGCMRGLETKHDSQSVGRSTTSAVVTSIFILAVADTVITVIFSVFQQM